MEMHKFFHMTGGEDEASYAKNSSLQRLVLREVKPILGDCIEELLRDMDFPSCVKVADLGCSSGPNTFLTLENIIQTIDEDYRIKNQEPPTIQFFLNDLVSNDFNTVFKGLPQFHEKLEKVNGRQKGSCLIAAIPGSFYGKLFPDHSMHFSHSSYCLHWLSQVPSGLLVSKPGMARNKGSIYCGKKSPPNVQQAYLDQFTQDFGMFLRMRSQEMVQHGQLLLTFLGKDGDEAEGSHFLFLMGMALSDMVVQGSIEDEKLDSFDLPIYTPSVQETMQVIENEGSFKILRFLTFKTSLDAAFEINNARDGDEDEDDGDDGPLARAKYVATCLRAVYEPVLAGHFGEAIMDDLFHRLAYKLVNTVQLRKGPYNNLVISLCKK